MEKLKIELTQKWDKNAWGGGSRADGSDPGTGWVLAVLKSAFIQGCNSDFSVDLAKVTGEGVKYDSIVDKLFVRRVPEILRTHIFPRFRRTWGLEDVVEACDEEGIALDVDTPGDSKILYDEFLKVVNFLRKKEEREGDEEEKEDEDEDDEENEGTEDETKDKEESDDADI